MGNQGYVYVFRDRLNRNLIKVGLSKSPFDRIKQLYTTSAAAPLNVSHIWHVHDMRLAEKIAHEVLRGHRINKSREFFEIAPSEGFNEFERACDETTTIYIDTLVELIEDGFEYLELTYSCKNVMDMFELYQQGKAMFPNGYKGF